MVLLKILGSHQFRTLFKPQKPLYFDSLTPHFKSRNPLQPTLHSPIFSESISTSAICNTRRPKESNTVENGTKNSPKSNKLLSIVFKEAVGLCDKPDQSDSEDVEGNGEAKELKKSFKDLEKEIRILKENDSNVIKKNIQKNKKLELGNGILSNESTEKLSEVFVNGDNQDSGEKLSKVEKGGRVLKDGAGPVRLSAFVLEKLVEVKEASGTRFRRVEQPIVCKELPSNMVEFARHLYKLGYFKNANFLPKNKFDATCFENNYARDFLTHAAEEFARDHREIAKWLSGSELKKVALFGCPSLSKKTIFCAKSLRVFFNISEDTVCSKCAMKKSCKFVDQSVWKSNAGKLELRDIMNVIILYALESGPPELVVSDEIKTSVTRLLEEVVKLSQKVS